MFFHAVQNGARREARLDGTRGVFLGWLMSLDALTKVSRAPAFRDGPVHVKGSWPDSVDEGVLPRLKNKVDAQGGDWWGDPTSD